MSLFQRKNSFPKRMIFASLFCVVASPNNPSQLEFRFKLQEKFVKVMTHWLHDGTAGRIGGNAFMILVYVRSHVGPQGTHAFPSQDNISEAMKLDRKTVRKSIKVLEKEGFVGKTKVGRHHEYHLSEFLLAVSENPDLHGDAVLQVPFGYGERKKLQPQLKFFEKTGRLPANSIIKIVNNITINMPIMSDESTAVFISHDPEKDAEQIQNPRIRELYVRAAKAAKNTIKELTTQLSDDLQQELTAMSENPEEPEKEEEDQ